MEQKILFLVGDLVTLVTSYLLYNLISSEDSCDEDIRKV